jgi:hypothetical protein
VRDTHAASVCLPPLATCRLSLRDLVPSRVHEWGPRPHPNRVAHLEPGEPVFRVETIGAVEGAAPVHLSDDCTHQEAVVVVTAVNEFS